MTWEKRLITKISSQQVTPALRALFSPSDPAWLRCFAVLDGTACGAIYTDNANEPGWGVVQEAAFNSLYLAGELHHPLIRRLIARLRRDGDLLVGLWQTDPRWSLLPSAPVYSGYTLEFTDRDPQGALPGIPLGLELRRLEPSLFKHLLGAKMLISMFGSVDQALKHGHGLCLVQDGEILCESFAGPSAMGLVEIGVECHPRHMRNGYATITCSHLIYEMEQAGFSTYWNCASDNLASIALARKLGYRTEKDYCIRAWCMHNDNH